MKIYYILKALFEIFRLKRHNQWSYEKIISYRDQNVNKIRKFAYSNSPFYQKFHEGKFDSPLESLPVLTKKIMMENFDEFVTDRDIRINDIRNFISSQAKPEKYLGKYYINCTSGSSGTPGVFLYSSEEWIKVMAGFARMQDLSGMKLNLFNPPKRAVISSTVPTHMSYLLGTTIDNFMMPTLRIPLSDSIEEIVEKLNNQQPDCLIGFASVLTILAEEQKAKRLFIKPANIFSSAEVLTEKMRTAIDDAFHAEVFNEYAATECGSIAAECRNHSGLHLFEDSVYLEVVDDKNNPVPNGMFGDKLLITVLSNKTQPLIRYQLTDCIKIATKICGCGLPYILIDGIQGRMEEVLELPSKEKSSRLISIHPLVFHQIMDFIPSASWQVIYEKEKLRVLIVGLSENHEGKVLDAIRDGLRKKGVMEIPIQIEHVDEIPKNPGGKTPLIKKK